MVVVVEYDKRQTSLASDKTSSKHSTRLYRIFLLYLFLPINLFVFLLPSIQIPTFALFTLTIIHFKRAQDRGARILDGPEDGVIGGPVSRNVLKARRFTSSWSMDFGWGGVTLCALASVAWILLSKIMRFSPIAAMIA